MKKLIIKLFPTFFVITFLQSQEKTKDTLYFAVDQYYTISPTITPNLSNQKYVEWLEATSEQMKHTNTNGYIYFIGNGFLTKGLRPKKILSIKEYLENRKFYYDGKYNNNIDNYKLQDSLLNKYTIYFVNGKEFIQPRYLEYKSFYTRKNNVGEFISNPNTKRDTLYFNLDNKYVYPSKNKTTTFLIKDGGNESSGLLFFQSIKTLKPSNPSTILDMEKYIHTSRFYNIKKQIIDKRSLGSFLNNYIIILVRKNEENLEYIQIQASYVIE